MMETQERDGGILPCRTSHDVDLMALTHVLLLYSSWN